MSRVELEYSIGLSRLSGTARLYSVVGPGGSRERIDMHAVSGGRAGSTSVAPDPLLADNVAASWIRSTGKPGAAGHTEGGPIPLGSYRLLRPGSRGTHGWIPIEPRYHFALGRTDLYIHPTGPHGSDGCIVLSSYDYDYLREILKVSSAGSSGGVAGELEVVE